MGVEGDLGDILDLLLAQHRRRSAVPPIAANSEAVRLVSVVRTFGATFLPAGVTRAFLVGSPCS